MVHDRFVLTRKTILLIGTIVVTLTVGIVYRLFVYGSVDKQELLYLFVPAVVAMVVVFFLPKSTTNSQKVYRSVSLALLITASGLGMAWVALLFVAPVFYIVADIAVSLLEDHAKDT